MIKFYCYLQWFRNDKLYKQNEILIKINSPQIQNNIKLPFKYKLNQYPYKSIRYLYEKL